VFQVHAVAASDAVVGRRRLWRDDCHIQGEKAMTNIRAGSVLAVLSSSTRLCRILIWRPENGKQHKGKELTARRAMILGSHSRHRHESIVKLLHRILSGAHGLMFGALVRAAERWRGLPFTEFELRQLAAIREDLNREYEAAITPTARSSQPRFSSRNVL
jgi:hypothetical protein